MRYMLSVRPGCENALDLVQKDGQPVPARKGKYQQLQFNGWVVDYNHDQRQLNVRKTDKIFCRSFRFLAGDGTLYLTEKKDLSANFVQGDHTAHLCREFNIREVRFANPKRNYPDIANVNGIRLQLRWVHSSSPVICEPTANITQTYHCGPESYFDTCGSYHDFRIDCVALWAVADYFADATTQTPEQPYPILYTMEKNYGALLSSLHRYCQQMNERDSHILQSGISVSYDPTWHQSK